MKVTRKKTLIYSILLAIIILSIIPLARTLFHDSILQGHEPYYNIKLSNDLLQNNFQDDYSLDTYHFLLTGTVIIFGTYLSSIALPFILGILSVILVCFILDQFKIQQLKKFIILIILIISPVFVYTFSTSNSYAFSVFLLLFGFYAFIKHRQILSIISFILLSMFNIINPIIALLLLYSYISYNKKRVIDFYGISSLIIITTFTYNLLLYNQFYIMDAFSQGVLINFISDLGGIMGFGIFSILLAVIGVYIIWTTKKQIVFGAMLAFLIIASIFLNHINIYLNFLFALFAGFGLFVLIKMRWKVKLIKSLTLIILVAGLLFSSISYINRESNSLPNSQMIDSLEWISLRSEGVILSHHTNGFWIESIAEKPVVSSQILKFSSKTVLKDTNELFYSRNLENTISLLDKYDVTYIWINKEMKNGLIWTKEDEGLLFLFRNTKVFKKLYDRGDVEIWKYLK